MVTLHMRPILSNATPAPQRPLRPASVVPPSTSLRDQARQWLNTLTSGLNRVGGWLATLNPFRRSATTATVSAAVLMGCSFAMPAAAVDHLQAGLQTHRISVAMHDDAIHFDTPFDTSTAARRRHTLQHIERQLYEAFNSDDTAFIDELVAHNPAEVETILRNAHRLARAGLGNAALTRDLCDFVSWSNSALVNRAIADVRIAPTA